MHTGTFMSNSEFEREYTSAYKLTVSLGFFLYLQRSSEDEAISNSEEKVGRQRQAQCSCRKERLQERESEEVKGGPGR